MADIVPSEELRALMHRFYAAWQARDFDTMTDMISAQPYSLIIGTDLAEWWNAREALYIWMVQASDLGRISIRSTALTAYSLGNVGWAADQITVEFEGGEDSATMRVTGVFAIERGHWRFVQMHASIGQANEQVVGRSVTTRIENIERSVCLERPEVTTGSAPDGTVTIVFSDIESSTVLLERLGDTSFQRLLAWHDDTVRGSAEEHRGYELARSLGIFTFGAPRIVKLKGLVGEFQLHPVIS